MSKDTQNDKLSRSNLSILIQIVTGQNSLNYLTSKIVPAYTDQCRFCEEEEETFIHLLNECPVFYQQRQDILSNQPIINSDNWKPKALIKFVKNTQILEALLENRDVY